MTIEIANGFKEAECREWIVKSLWHALVQDVAGFNLDILPLDTDQSTSPREVERQEVASEFDISLDSWLRCLTEHSEVFGHSGESYTIQVEHTLSPDVIRAPLRSVRPDKRALLSE